MAHYADEIDQVMLFVFVVLFFLCGCSTASSHKDMESAVTTVAESLRHEDMSAKYCPVCGKHYSAKLETCVVDGNLLKAVEK